MKKKKGVKGSQFLFFFFFALIFVFRLSKISLFNKILQFNQGPEKIKSKSNAQLVPPEQILIQHYFLYDMKENDIFY